MTILSLHRILFSEALDKISPMCCSIMQVGHCAEFAVGMRFGAGPRLIIGATDGKLIVGGTVGSPDNVA